MYLNGAPSVRIFDGATNRNIPKRIIESHGDEIGFLKVYCEGGSTIFCFNIASEGLANLRLIALEIHKKSPYSKTDFTE